MSMDWFRSHHGAPTDPKWLLIAHRAKSKPGIVSSLVWAMFDYASQHEDRGSTDGFDMETYAIYSGFDEPELHRIHQALKDKELIIDDRFTNWEKRQPDRERSETPGKSTERVRRHRENKKLKHETDETLHETKCNNETEVTPVTPRNAIDKTRQDSDQNCLNNLSLVAAHEHDLLIDDLDFNDFFVCVNVFCSLFGKSKLTVKEQEAISEWCSHYDMRKVFPDIKIELNKFRNKNHKDPTSIVFFQWVVDKFPRSGQPDYAKKLADKMRMT